MSEALWLKWRATTAIRCKYFVRQRVPVLGIEPAANVAKVAVEKVVPSLVRFFGTKLAKSSLLFLKWKPPACLRRRAQVKIGGTVGGASILPSVYTIPVNWFLAS